MPQRWTDQYMSTWDLVPPSCRDVYFNYLIFQMNTIKYITWFKYTPPQYPRRPWKLTPVSHIYICLIYWCIVSYCVYYCQKDPIEATIIYDSLLRYQIRVRHDRLKCKQMFLERKFLEFSPQIDWIIIQLTSSPGNLTFLWSSGSEPGEQPVQSNVVKFMNSDLDAWGGEVGDLKLDIDWRLQKTLI